MTISKIVSHRSNVVSGTGYRALVLASASVSTLLLSASLSSSAVAQTQAVTNPSAAAPNVEEIVVTGSRIVRDGYSAPTPLTVVGEEAIQAAAPYNLADYVNQLPSVVGSLNPRQSAGNASSGTTGVNALNLRGLGTTRTLVLLDGQRSVAAAVDSTVDVGSMPQGLVSRVEVVTGGASAAYGSDAVAGVVNFVLDKDFVGVKGSVEGGITTYGDDASWKIGMTGGAVFSEGRGHFLIDAQAASIYGIAHGFDRDWNNSGFQSFPNPAYAVGNGAPQYIAVYGAGPSTATPGGLITTTALKGTAFGAGGVPYNFVYGSLVGGNFMQGGDWQANKYVRAVVIEPPASRQNIFTRATYDITDNLQAFVQLSWAGTHSSNELAYGFHLGSLTMKADNAFLPASVAAQAAALKITQFNMGKFYLDLHNHDGTTMIVGDNVRFTNRYVVGASGKVDAFDSVWSWNGYYQNGITRTSEHQFNAYDTTKFALATDDVRDSTGKVICRSTLTNPNNGCVPYNVFGTDVNNSSAVNYLLGEGSYRHQKFQQDVIAATVRGEPFSVPAGTVSFATGFEWRQERASGAADPTSQLQRWFTGNYGATNGKYNVKEGFAETVVPLAKATSWAESLDINAAVRLTDYSTSGSVVTWKIGTTYQPVDDLRFRATRSRDIRAPNLGDLYAGGSSSAGSPLQDPFNGNVATPSQTFSHGNPLLAPEKADTTGVGVVLQPRFFPGFSASVDYWNIHLNGGIGSLSAQQILNSCYLGAQAQCGAVSREAGTGRILLQVIPFNIATQISKGLDLEASYRVGLDQINDGWGGMLSFRVLATHYLKNYSNNNITPATDTAGSNGGSGPPSWLYNGSITYKNNPITITLTGHGLSSGTADNTYIGCASGCPLSTVNNPTINSNYVPGRFYLDTNIDYEVTENISAFLRVNNIRNTDPPVVPSSTGASGERAPPTNRVLYDLVGREFHMGIRFKM